MGVFDFLFRASAKALPGRVAAADARVAELKAAFPNNTQVTVEVDEEPLPTAYTVMVPGRRLGLRALVDRTDAVIFSLQKNEQVDLRLGDSSESGTFSSILISGWNLHRPHVESLVRAHDALAALLVDHSLVIDGLHGGYGVIGVARHDAVGVAQILVGWWENMLESELEQWPYSGIYVEFSGTSDAPGIGYTVDLEDPDDDSGIEPPTLEEKRQHARRAAAAWTENLPDLEALTKVRVRRGYSVELGFSAPLFTPRVVVEDLDSGEEDKDEAAEILAAIRFHNPATSSTVGP